MPKNVMKMLKPSPKRGKNAFDLSHRHVMAAYFGELLPITCLETVPGDYFEIGVADLIRAMPMVTSPFMRAKQHVDFWFVPYTDLWHQFNSFITQKEQPQSSALKSASYCPHACIDDLITKIFGQATQNITDVCGISYQKGARTLFNLLGYGNPGNLSSSGYPHVNLWRIAAYNYIWYNEYRQQYYDNGMKLLNANQSPASLFNFDNLDCSTYNNADLLATTYGDYTMQAMFQMRYRCWKKDLFTGILPSTQFGAVSAVDTSLPQNVLIKSTSATANSVSTDSTGLLLNGTVGLWNLNPSQSPYLQYGNFDVLALRQAQAVQIWRENALRAGNRVNDNINAHYGEFPMYQRDHRPTYIGSYDAPLNISDINATAQTGTGGNEQLGDIAGKGLSSLDSKKLKFNCNDFGVIMGIFSLLPEAEYNAFGCDRPNQLLDRFDYFSPEMENLGLEAVSTNEFLVLPSSSQKILGYAPRYYGYKQKIDKCFGAFQTNAPLQIWCSPKYDVNQAISTLQYGMPLNVLYVNPQIFDVNFVSAAQNIGEQFLCDFFFDVEAVRPMTVLGLPTY